MTIQTVDLSKLSVLSKRLRKELVLEALENDTYDRYGLAKELHVHERTIRRYINEIAEQLCDPHEDRMRILRAKCLGRLTKKVHEDKLSDELLVKLLISGEPKKLEAKTEYAETLTEVKVLIVDNSTNPVQSTSKATGNIQR